MNKFEFIVQSENGHVLIASDNPQTQIQIQEEVGGFFQVDELVHAKTQRLGVVNCVTDATEFDRQMDRMKQVPALEFMMHMPKNTPRERRKGAIGIDENHITYCYSITKNSVITADQRSHEVVVYNPDKSQANKEVRRVVRDQLLVRFEESRGGIVIHSSCLAYKNGDGILVAGSSGSGKTSFFMETLKHSDDFFGMTCERTIVANCGDKLIGQGVPEKINIFPGTIQNYDLTHVFPEGAGEEGKWSRPSKIKVPWKRLFASFNAKPPDQEIQIRAILVPMFSNDEQGIEKVDKTNLLELLEPELLTFNDSVRPNWLSWYWPSFAATRSTLAKLANLPAYKVSWGADCNLREYIDAVHSKGD
jgi:hypothetical protein